MFVSYSTCASYPGKPSCSALEAAKPCSQCPSAQPLRALHAPEALSSLPVPQRFSLHICLLLISCSFLKTWSIWSGLASGSWSTEAVSENPVSCSQNTNRNGPQLDSAFMHSVLLGAVGLCNSLAVLLFTDGASSWRHLFISSLLLGSCEHRWVFLAAGKGSPRSIY